MRFVSRFFSRVRACVGVRARIGARVGWGGVQGRRSFWARARRLVSTYTPGTQRDKLFTFTTTPRLFTTPKATYHEPKGDKLFTTTLYHAPSFFTFPKAVWRLFASLWVTFSLGYLIGFSLGGGC